MISDSRSDRVRYDVRVRSVLGPAVRACLAPGGQWTSLERGTVFRFDPTGEHDLIEVYDLLIENKVDVIGIRRASRPG
jgi:hypothetical protein